MTRTSGPLLRRSRSLAVFVVGTALVVTAGIAPLTESALGNKAQLADGVRELDKEVTAANPFIKSSIRSTGPTVGVIRLCRLARQSGNEKAWVPVSILAGQNVDSIGAVRGFLRFTGLLAKIQSAVDSLPAQFKSKAEKAKNHLEAGWHNWGGVPEGTLFELTAANKKAKSRDCGAAEDNLHDAISDNNDAKDEFALGLKQMNNLLLRLP